MNKMIDTVVIKGTMGEVTRKLLEWETKIEGATEVTIKVIHEIRSDRVLGYEVTITDETPCTLAYHRELVNVKGLKKCPDCGLHIMGPRRRS